MITITGHYDPISEQRPPPIEIYSWEISGQGFYMISRNYFTTAAKAANSVKNMYKKYIEPGSRFTGLPKIKWATSPKYTRRY